MIRPFPNDLRTRLRLKSKARDASEREIPSPVVEAPRLFELAVFEREGPYRIQVTDAASSPPRPRRNLLTGTLSRALQISCESCQKGRAGGVDKEVVAGKHLHAERAACLFTPGVNIARPQLTIPRAAER